MPALYDEVGAYDEADPYDGSGGAGDSTIAIPKARPRRVRLARGLVLPQPVAPLVPARRTVTAIALVPTVRAAFTWKETRPKVRKAARKKPAAPVAEAVIPSRRDVSCQGTLVPLIESRFGVELYDPEATALDDERIMFGLLLSEALSEG